jgi:RNA polymerase sigma-70 factor (ECF subfamily)
MGNKDAHSRLSRITTLWTMVGQAHHGTASDAASAQRVLMERYCGAVYRYLLGAVHNPEVAEELFQEFALRFCRGDFHRADPTRGRFRDYVRTALINLVNDYHHQRKVSPRPLPPDLAGPAPSTPDLDDAQFVESWSKELMNQAWAELDRGHPALGVVLRFHVENPDVQSPQVAEQLSAQLGKRLTPTNARVMLHRAREKYAELLVEEVRRSLESPTQEQLLQELREPQLLTHCRPALERRSMHP